VTRRRRLVAVIALATAGVVLSIVWAVPTFAGAAFVSVRAIVVPLPGTGSGPSILLADGSIADTGRVRIDLEVTNRYPLPVVVGFLGSAFEARLRPAGQPAASTVWRATADDRQLEQEEDSPDAVTSTRVVLLEPGTRIVSMTASGATLDLSTAPGVIAPASYSLAASAYGIAAPDQPLTTTSSPQG
jgi:hypothetical protein